MQMKVVVVGLLVTGLVACGSEQEDSASVSMANPASVYCVEQGGDPQIKKTAEGEVGYCHFTDGRVVEQWDFYRASLE
ncbi:hypothetical protein OAG1_32520 [Agarivorans sp. OAG1]|nr:hypothetical protein OAG1_32520 [Agarivorans sp. OAG1]